MSCYWLKTASPQSHFLTVPFPAPKGHTYKPPGPGRYYIIHVGQQGHYAMVETCCFAHTLSALLDAHWHPGTLAHHVPRDVVGTRCNNGLLFDLTHINYSHRRMRQGGRVSCIRHSAAGIDSRLPFNPQTKILFTDTGADGVSVSPRASLTTSKVLG